MRYADGNDAKIGDVVAIDDQYQGVVVASIDSDEYSAQYPKEDWAFLQKGVLIDTNFAGLVHYSESSDEHMVLLRRANTA
jgi:hypothetical protein